MSVCVPPLSVFESVWSTQADEAGASGLAPIMEEEDEHEDEEDEDEGEDEDEDEEDPAPKGLSAYELKRRQNMLENQVLPYKEGLAGT